MSQYTVQILYVELEQEIAAPCLNYSLSKDIKILHHLNRTDSPTSWQQNYQAEQFPCDITMRCQLVYKERTVHLILEGYSLHHVVSSTDFLSISSLHARCQNVLGR